jgi:hypothetical protein
MQGTPIFFLRDIHYQITTLLYQQMNTYRDMRVGFQPILRSQMMFVI